MRRFYLILFLVIILFTTIVKAQTNPYRYGTPHYWMAQATLNIYDGKFDLAYKNLQKAKVGYKNLGDITYLVNAVEAMGGVKYSLGEWHLADKHYREALNIAKESKDNVSHAKVLIDIITFYKNVGNITGYNLLVSELDSIYKTTLSAEVKTLYHIYWSNVYASKQEYVMAEFHLQRCLDVMQELPLIEREQSKLSFYYNMMMLKKQIKNYDEAIVYAKKYIEQSKIINWKYSNLNFQSYASLVKLYAIKTDSIQTFKALDCMEGCIVGSLLDKSMLTAYYNLRASCCAIFKNYDEALELLEKSNILLTDRAIEDTPPKYKYYEYKSEILYKQQKYDESYDIYKKCVQACKDKYGENSGEYYKGLYSLAYLDAERGNIHKADSLYRISMNYLLSNMKRQWTYLTQSQRELYSKEILENVGGMADFAIKCDINNNELTETCYNALLFSKSLLLETDKSLLDLLSKEGSEKDLNDYRRLIAVNYRLSFFRSLNSSNKEEIDTLVQQQRELELHLSNMCQLYSSYNAFLDFDYSKIKKELKDDEILIDFADYQTEDSLRQYVAYIVDRKHKYPILVKCFTQGRIDSLLNGHPDCIYDNSQFKDYATKLFWEPLNKYVDKIKTVYYVPSGVIHEIAIESLPLADGTILSQHFNFVRLSSAREIKRRNVSISKVKTATLYGGLKYNVDSDVLEAESNVYEKSELASILRSKYGNEEFKYLRKTKDEINKIEITLKNNGYIVRSFSGVKGNAESFISMSGNSPSILHIATHGFYFTPDEACKYDFFSGYEDAMSLSGLIFSGGNAAWLKKDIPEGVLGGVLTARDIANLNLKDTDLVVLSACHTAKGKATAEGLYGLQRAFKKAGAGTLILTLWTVRDVVAEAFTTTFYQELFMNGGDKRLAFENTKNIIRKKYKDPFDWACFVMID